MAILAVVALLGSLAAVVMAQMSFREVRDFIPPTSPAASTSAGAATGAQTSDVELGDLFVKPASLAVAAGTDLTLTVTNHGSMGHDLTVEGGSPGTGNIDPGKSASLHVGVVQKSMQLWCTVPGHKGAGMVMTVAVQGSASGSAASTKAQPASTNAVIDFNATPGANWKPFDPALQPAIGATEHTVTIEANEVVKEIAPGVKQQVWAFNGHVPGPTLRGHVGDVFTVTLVNKGSMGHSIDFHASRTPMDTNMRTLKPGESLVYQYTATAAGIFMYHCGTAPALHHIGNGMFGAVVIDPPGLPSVDHEYVFVQSEIYTGPQNQPGDFEKMTKVTPDAVVFNGYVNQYKYAPIMVKPHDRIRAWVLDAGPSENSSFHVVGTIFDTTFKEGTYLLRPDAGKGGAQALDLQPAQGGFVEFTLDEPGMYAMVTHKFANVGKGAVGVFHVM